MDEQAQLELDPVLDWQSVQFSQGGRHMVAWSEVHDKYLKCLQESTDSLPVSNKYPNFKMYISSTCITHSLDIVLSLVDKSTYIVFACT